MNLLWQLLDRIGRLFTWWIIVYPWEAGLRVRLGKHVKELHAGVHLKIPGADVVFKQSVRMRVVALPTQTLTTNDGKTLTLSGMVGYCITDIRKLYDTLHHADDTLRNLCQGAIAQYINTHGSAACEPQQIEKAAAGAMNVEQYGLGCATVYITDFAFVRTYRLISDAKWGTNYEALNTSHAAGVPS